MIETSPEDDARAVVHQHDNTADKANNVPEPATRQRNKVAQRSRYASLSYSGPLPPASELKAYEDACPGLARDIANMAMLEQQHRHQLENKEQDASMANIKTLVRNEHNETTLGQCLAFAVAFLILAASTYGFYLRFPIVAGVLGGSTMLSVVALFLKQQLSPNTRSNDDHLNDYDERNEED